MYRIIRWLVMSFALLGLLPAPFQAQDWLKVSAPDCDYGGEIRVIEALDALTVRFSLCYPDSAFPSKVAFSAFAIQPAEYLQNTGGTGELLTHPIGTGPYQFESWDAGEQITLRRFEDYWGVPALDDKLIFRWDASADARYAALAAGDVDGIDNPGRDAFTMIRDAADLMLNQRPSTAIFYVGINNRMAPFDNVLVRRAMAYAINKQRIVDLYYPEGSTVAGQFVPPTIFGHTAEVRPLPYDAERARTLLEEAGVSLPIQITLSYRNVVRGYLPQPAEVAQEIQQELANIGIEVTLNEIESGAFLDASSAGELGLHLLGWLPDYPDATNYLDVHFGAGASDQFGDHFTEISTPLSEASRLVEASERYPFYIEANTAIRDLVPMIPIAYGGSATAFQAQVTGAHSSPLSVEYFAVMDDQRDDDLIWMQNAEPISLYCADELDGESFRVCMQIHESLLGFSIAGTGVVPSLAKTYQANTDGTEWTFTLREGVHFHNGSLLDANDVVLSFVVQWDRNHPLHTGREGTFTYFQTYFGAFLDG